MPEDTDHMVKQTRSYMRIFSFIKRFRLEIILIISSVIVLSMLMIYVNTLVKEKVYQDVKSTLAATLLPTYEAQHFQELYRHVKQFNFDKAIATINELLP